VIVTPEPVRALGGEMDQIDDRRDLEIRSPFDGSTQHAVLSLPAGSARAALPLVIAPHPFTWSVEDDYHGGCAGLKASGHAGWLGVPTGQGVAVLQPDGHHRVVPGCSMGYEGVLADVPAWISAALEVAQIDRSRVYGCGLSMGGLESVLAAAAHPGLFAAVFAFNPVIDPAAWAEDMATTANPELRGEGIDRLIAEEVGGTPAEVPDAYDRRNVFGRLEALLGLPVSIWWSELDLVVPRQAERHGKRLYDELKRLDGTTPVTEYNHTRRYALSDPPRDDERWGLHETADYAFATRWLLLHRRT
jgi:pimeloyl-ACP methyl ester carboxylesterase